MTTILTNSSVYLGTNLFGKVQKFTTPEVETNTVDIKYGYGTFKLPVGVNALSCSMELLCLDENVFNRVANMFNETNLTVYGSLSKFNNETLTDEVQAKLVLRGSLNKRVTLGELVQQENATYNVDLNISAYKLIVNGSTWEHLDIPNLIWKINGSDVLGKLKKNLAL